MRVPQVSHEKLTEVIWEFCARNHQWAIKWYRHAKGGLWDWNSRWVLTIRNSQIQSHVLSTIEHDRGLVCHVFTTADGYWTTFLKHVYRELPNSQPMHPPDTAPKYHGKEGNISEMISGNYGPIVYHHIYNNDCSQVSRSSILSWLTCKVVYYVILGYTTEWTKNVGARVLYSIYDIDTWHD